MHYGGIYVDNDVIIVNSLDKYRYYEMTVGFEAKDRETMGNQALIAHKNARFLRAFFDTYRDRFDEDSWYLLLLLITRNCVKSIKFKKFNNKGIIMAVNCQLKYLENINF
jgi:hypothetical protein